MGENEISQGRAYKLETRKGRNRTLKNKTFKGQAKEERAGRISRKLNASAGRQV